MHVLRDNCYMCVVKAITLRMKIKMAAIVCPHSLGCSKFRYKSDIKSARIQLVKLLIFDTLYCEIVL